MDNILGDFLHSPIILSIRSRNDNPGLRFGTGSHKNGDLAPRIYDPNVPKVATEPLEVIKDAICPVLAAILKGAAVVAGRT
jgi:hypothetical protein